jgi:allantoicase
MGPDKEHFFDDELVDLGPVTHVRLNIYPDGGVSRLRLFGTLAA